MRPFSFELSDALLHESARRAADVVDTSPACWAYAVRVPLSPLSPGPPWRLVITVTVQVLSGRIGVGCLHTSETSFVAERFVEPTDAPCRVTLRVDAETTAALIIRNASDAGPSRFRFVRADAHHVPRGELTYPVHVSARRIDHELTRRDGTASFNDAAAAAINAARMAFVRELQLPLTDRRVLDVGAGVGHFSRLYADLGAVVVAVEGREENVEELRQRCPEADVHVADVQDLPVERLGLFDVVHCFGLLYHLDSPVAALRRLARVCQGVLLLETIVCDAASPVMMLADETLGANQALAGLGCRPSPAFVTMALNRVGFDWIYGAASPLAHPDFRFDWRNSLEWSRDGGNLRCVFVASRAELESAVLVPLMQP